MLTCFLMCERRVSATGAFVTCSFVKRMLNEQLGGQIKTGQAGEASQNPPKTKTKLKKSIKNKTSHHDISRTNQRLTGSTQTDEVEKEGRGREGGKEASKGLVKGRARG